jgi:hypothetical protein
MPIVEQRSTKDGTILAVGCAAGAGLLLVLALVFIFAAPMRMVTTTSGSTAATPSGTGSGSWGSGTFPNLPIPDGNARGVSYKLGSTSIPAVGKLTGLNLTVTLKHPHPEDLTVTLVSPTGGKALLRKKGTPGGLKTRYSTEAPLAKFFGKPAAGTWRVVVMDTVKGNKGTLEETDFDVSYAW